MKNLSQEVCKELKNLGIIKDIDPRTHKESYNFVKQPDGQWFKSTKSRLHEAPVLTPINAQKMPIFTKLTILIEEIDSEVKKEGGRIFITETIVFKIKKGTKIPILISEAITEKKENARYQKLCNEIVEHGLDKDRYRTEETYMLTKTANSDWSMSSSDENLSGTKKMLNLAKMPLLKALSFKMNKIDPQFQSNGGRIFITPTRIYRIKNKIEIDFKF